MCSVHYTEILRHFQTHVDLFLITIFQSSKHPCLNSTHFHCISTVLDQRKTGAETTTTRRLLSVWCRSQGWLGLLLVTWKMQPQEVALQRWNQVCYSRRAYNLKHAHEILGREVHARFMVDRYSTHMHTRPSIWFPSFPKVSKHIHFSCVILYPAPVFTVIDVVACLHCFDSFKFLINRLIPAEDFLPCCGVYNEAASSL